MNWKCTLLFSRRLFWDIVLIVTITCVIPSNWRLFFFSVHSCSCAEDQLHAVQLGPRAALWEAPRQRLCCGLLGAVRVQPRLCSARFHRHTVRERTRQPGPVERHTADLLRYLEHAKMHVHLHSNRDYSLRPVGFISVDEKMSDLPLLSPPSDKALF